MVQVARCVAGGGKVSTIGIASGGELRLSGELEEAGTDCRRNPKMLPI